MARMKRKTAKHEVNGMVAEYRGQLPLYEDFAMRCKELLEWLLRAEAIRVHSVTFRAKSCESLEGKLSRGEKQYGTLGEVTDLAGIRIITYFADDVDPVATIIEREFAVIPEHSIDKGKALDPDRFGYLSLHYVCTLSDQRARLLEYAAYKECVCEIQVRSILQHAWAEIEHDLGYKAVQGIPRPMQRRFSRLAGLLEVADDEFMRLRDELAAYASEVGKDIAERPTEVLIDSVSVATLIDQDDVVRRVDLEVAQELGADLEEASVSADLLVQALRYVGMDTIRDVLSALAARRGIVVRQIKFRLTAKPPRTLRRGISLVQLWQVLIAERGDPAQLAVAYDKLNITPVGKGRTDLAFELVAAVKRAMDETTGQPPKSR